MNHQDSIQVAARWLKGRGARSKVCVRVCVCVCVCVWGGGGGGGGRGCLNKNP